MIRIHDVELIGAIEAVLKKANYSEHPYDIASDIYNAIEPILEDIYEEGYDDGMEQEGGNETHD